MKWYHQNVLLILNNSLFVLYFKTTKELILGVYIFCIIWNYQVQMVSEDLHLWQKKQKNKQKKKKIVQL